MWVVEGVETSDWRRTDVTVPHPIPCAYSVICGRLHIFGCVSGERGARARLCVCVCTLGINSIQHFYSGNAGPLMESRCRAQKKRMRLLAARGTPSRRLEAGRGGLAEWDVSRKAPNGSRRKLLPRVGGGDRGLHKPGLPSGLSPHLRQLLLPGPELLFRLGFEAEPQRRLWPRGFLCGAPPPAPAPLSRLLSCSPSRPCSGLVLSFFNQVICLFSV